jgi:hypothetical protein
LPVYRETLTVHREPLAVYRQPLRYAAKRRRVPLHLSPAFSLNLPLRHKEALPFWFTYTTGERLLPLGFHEEALLFCFTYTPSPTGKT